jgi:phage-related protein
LYGIYYYAAKNGKQTVKEYIDCLAAKTDKESRIKLAKIRAYMKLLEEYGLSAGEPYVKHIHGEIWELRPLRDRIFFARWDGNNFVLLHHFIKKTAKTPRREITKAINNYKDLLRRT